MTEKRTRTRNFLVAEIRRHVCPLRFGDVDDFLSPNMSSIFLVATKIDEFRACYDSANYKNLSCDKNWWWKVAERYLYEVGRLGWRWFLRWSHFMWWAVFNDDICLGSRSFSIYCYWGKFLLHSKGTGWSKNRFLSAISFMISSEIRKTEFRSVELDCRL